jgi:UDP-N-acetylglucosamine 2-epimerase (non-hydrolysing)
MKVMTILGTRPEIIRLSRVIPLLDRLCDHVLVHTGQNYDRLLSDVFFDELSVRQPDRFLAVRAASFGQQIANIMAASETALREERPDRLLLLGDTNSSLAALIAKRLGIQVFHMEAGNRCFDDRVPEEVNRRVIDHSSDVLMPYTERSRDNLLREGFESDRVHVIGNPIYEVLQAYMHRIDGSDVLPRLGLLPEEYILVTMHREENVDIEWRLRALVEALARVHEAYGKRIVVSVHPRTRATLELSGVGTDMPGISFLEPFPLFDFVALEKNAFCVLSDSGTVQEECCIFRVPNVTIRDVTERPETVDVGSNMLSGAQPDSILQCVRTVVAGATAWTVPSEYVVPDVSTTVAKIVLGYREARRR